MIVTIDQTNAEIYKVWFNAITAALSARAKEADGSKYNFSVNSLEDYYSHIQLITEATGGMFLRMPTDEDILVINNNTRTIDVKNTSFFKNGIAVESDHLAEIIYFKVDRYFDRTDLANEKIQIEIRWSLTPTKKTDTGNSGVSKAVFKDVESYPGYIVFGWPITREMCAVAGTLSFAVSFRIGAQDDVSTHTYNLNTLLASLPVKSGIGISGTLEVINEANNIIESLVNSTYTPAGITPLDDPYYKYLSWKQDDIDNVYTYPPISTDYSGVTFAIANLGTKDFDTKITTGNDILKLSAEAYCPSATALSYGALYNANSGTEDFSALQELSEDIDENNIKAIGFKLDKVEMTKDMVYADLNINSIYGDVFATYYQKSDDGSWTVATQEQVKKYFAGVYGIATSSEDPTEEERASIASMAKERAVIYTNKAGYYRFSAQGQKDVTLEDGKTLTVHSNVENSSIVVIPPACDPVCTDLTITLDNGDADFKNILFVENATEEDKEKYQLLAKDGTITMAKTAGLGIKIGNVEEITTHNTLTSSSSLYKEKTLADDYKVFAGDFAFIVEQKVGEEDTLYAKLKAELGEGNNSLTSEQVSKVLEEEYDTETINKLFNLSCTIEDNKFVLAELGASSAPEEESITLTMDPDNGRTISAFIIHRKNGTYSAIHKTSSKIVTYAASELKTLMDDGTPSMEISYSFEDSDGTYPACTVADFKTAIIKDNTYTYYNVVSSHIADPDQGLKLQAHYKDADANGTLVFEWYAGDTLSEAIANATNKVQRVDVGVEGFSIEKPIKEEDNSWTGLLTIDGSVDFNAYKYLVPKVVNTLNSTYSNIVCENAGVYISEQDVIE